MHDFIDQDKKWDLCSVGMFLPSNVLADIKEILIPLSPMKDRGFWGFSQDSKFTLKSATWVMRKPSSHPRSKMLKWIWKLNLLPKIKFFLWLVVRDAFPTCKFLSSRKIDIPIKCHFCSHNVENIDHVVRKCTFVQGI